MRVVRHDRASAAVCRAAAALQAACGVQGGKVPRRGSRVWAVYARDGVMLGYATAIMYGRTAWLRYCVVDRAARGGGIQRRLLRARLRWARARRATCVRTYTSYDNWPSYRNLVAAGFRVTRGYPDPAASGGGWVYWRRALVGTPSRAARSRRTPSK